MHEALIKIKTVPGEAWAVLALFFGATIHAIRLKQVAVAEGLTGAFISFVGGFFFLKLICFVFSLDLGEVWFFGFPASFMANYWLGGMETVGAQIRDTPVQWIVSTLGIVADEALAKWDKIAERFKPTQTPK